MRDLLFSMEQDTKIAILKDAYDRERFIKAKNLAYVVIGLKKSGAACEEKIFELKNEIRKTIKDVRYSLDAQQLEDGIQDIFDDSINDRAAFPLL
jgi:hypothetical protein